MLRAKQIRQAAWDLLGRSPSQYWNFILVIFLVGLLIGCAAVLVAFLTLLPTAGIVAFYSHSQSQPPFALIATLSIFCAAIFVPLFVYLVGYHQWVAKLTQLEVLRAPLNVNLIWSGRRQAWRMGWIWLVMTTYIQLWALLLIVPGIIKMFSYAMTSFVAVEHPDWTANQCITESCRLMEGNRWRYFCLNVSFIGWILLAMAAAFLPVIGNFAFYFLMPYLGTSQAIFYSVLKEERPLMPAGYANMYAGHGA